MKRKAAEDNEEELEEQRKMARTWVSEVVEDPPVQTSGDDDCTCVDCIFKKCTW